MNEEENVFNVYLRASDVDIAKFEIVKDDHFDAIIEVQEFFIREGIGYNEPILAVIEGGKK